MFVEKTSYAYAALTTNYARIIPLVLSARDETKKKNEKGFFKLGHWDVNMISPAFGLYVAGITWSYRVNGSDNCSTGSVVGW